MARTTYLPVVTIMCIVTLTFDQGRNSSLGQCNNSVKHYSNPWFQWNLWPRQCLNHYEYSDLDLWPVTLDQGCDTFFGPGQ